MTMWEYPTIIATGYTTQGEEIVLPSQITYKFMQPICAASVLNYVKISDK